MKFRVECFQAGHFISRFAAPGACCASAVMTCKYNLVHWRLEFECVNTELAGQASSTPCNTKTCLRYLNLKTSHGGRNRLHCSPTPPCAPLPTIACTSSHAQQMSTPPACPDLYNSPSCQHPTAHARVRLGGSLAQQGRRRSLIIAGLHQHTLHASHSAIHRHQTQQCLNPVTPCGAFT